MGEGKKSTGLCEGLAPLPGLIQAMLRAEQVEDRFDRIGSNREMKNPPEEGGFQ